jgi:hypothetical protein
VSREAREDNTSLSAEPMLCFVVRTRRNKPIHAAWCSAVDPNFLLLITLGNNICLGLKKLNIDLTLAPCIF